jgi:hypothetical protein
LLVFHVEQLIQIRVGVALAVFHVEH